MTDARAAFLEKLGPRAEPAKGLRRELRLLEVVTITVGSMIGSGIFFVPADVAAAFPSPGAMALLWLAGGLVTMCGALTFAELVTMFPASGGPYVFMREAFGKLPGFLAGWSMLLGKVFVGPAVALVFAQYLSFLFPLTARGVVLVAAWAIVTVAFVNWMGVRFGGLFQNVFTFLKVGALLLVVALAALLSDAAAATRAELDAPTVAASAALVGIVFAYNSWFNPTFVAEEVKRPDRDLPLGLALGVAIVTGIYVAATLAYWALLGSGGMAGSTIVAADAARAVVPWGGALVSWGVLVSAFGNLNGGTLVTARMGLAMGRDNYLPRFERLNAHAVPGVAIVAFAAVQLVLLAFLDFRGLATYGSFVTWLFLVLVVASVYAFRRRDPHRARPYRTWGYPLTPAVFIAGTTAFILVLAMQRPLAVVGGLAAIAAGLPLYFLAARGRTL